MPDRTENQSGDTISRRQFVTSSAAALAWTAFPFYPATNLLKENKIGVSLASYYMRWRSDNSSSRYPAWKDALDMMNHCHLIGAGGVQTSVQRWTKAFAGQVHALKDKLGIFLEGQIRLPQSDDEVAAFDNDVSNAREAGIVILRAACLNGRRYETFKTRGAFAAFKADAIRSIERAGAVCKKYQMRLAIENHKDWYSEELAGIIKNIGSEWVGVTLDNGNNLALLEDPMFVVETLAPYAFTTHFKDMGVEMCDDGFLVSEVPFGQGFYDLPAMISTLKKHNPEITFNLEMITRDPLEVPCLTDSYFATSPEMPATRLAAMMKMVRDNNSPKPLQRISDASQEEQLGFEEENNVACIVYAKERLGLG